MVIVVGVVVIIKPLLRRYKGLREEAHRHYIDSFFHTLRLKTVNTRDFGIQFFLVSIRFVGDSGFSVFTLPKGGSSKGYS